MAQYGEFANWRMPPRNIIKKDIKNVTIPRHVISVSNSAGR